MSKHVLITGGAGFIGSHLADELLDHGYRVRASISSPRKFMGWNGRDLIISTLRLS